jgi:hypothetical protein
MSAEAFLILQNVDNRVRYLSGMIKHASACEEANKNASVRIGKTGKRQIQRQPFYWIAYKGTDGNLQTYNFYSYVDNIEKYKSPNDESWTAAITLDALLEWVLNGGAANA